MKKPAPSTWIIIGLGIVIALLILFWPSSGPSQREIQLEQENKELLTQIDSFAVRTQSILNEVRQDSINTAEKQSRLISQGNAYKREVQRLKANPIIIRVREEVPEVDSLITAQDSVITNQGHQIAALEHAYGKLSVNLVGITRNFESRVALERQRYENTQELLNEKDKDLRREKKKGKLAKVLIPVAFVGGILLGGL